VIVAERRAEPAAVDRAPRRIVEVGEVFARLEPVGAVLAEPLAADFHRVDRAVAEHLIADSLLVDDDAEGIARARVGREAHMPLEHFDEDADERTTEPRALERATERARDRAPAP